MGYASTMLRKDVTDEQKALQKKAKKKGLWGSIGRTIGSLAVMGITGGAVNPLTLGLLTGGASFLGGAIGAKAAGGKLTGGKFFKSDREELQKELGAFGSQNITSSLKSGLQAGLGQAAKLQKAKLFGPEGAGEAAKGLDFEHSFVGKGLEKRAIGKELMKTGEESLGTRSTLFGEGEYGASADFPQQQFRRHAEFAPGEMTSKIDKAGISRYGGGGTGIDPSIKSTGNEFIDIQLGEYTKPDSSSINLSRYPYLDKYNKSSWQKTLFSEGLE